MRGAMARVSDLGFAFRRPLRMPLVLRLVARRPRDTLAAMLAAGLAVAILVNALFMQSGPHPAPIFANRPPPLVAPIADPMAALLPPRAPTDAKRAAGAELHPRSDTVAEIQRELVRRGFYEGAPDGVYGPKTDAAIRDFEEAAGLRPSAEPNNVLLAAIRRSNAKAALAAAPRSDPIAALLAPSARLVAVQRALSDFGYGPLKPTGALDPATRAAIERFERARKRPVTGKVSEQLVRDLAAMTGRPLE
jgi:peptidoglycan hydrolase-like protein with peptidoglycan-binding domain